MDIEAYKQAITKENLSTYNEGKDMQKVNVSKQSLSEILDMDLLDTYIQQIYVLVGVPVTILDSEGEIVAASQWTDICKNFMRTDNTASIQCINACTRIGDFGSGIFKCPNGLCMYSVPIVVRDTTVAYLVLSQFLMYSPNREFFHKTLKNSSIDEESYNRAINSIPIVTKKRIQEIIDFLNQFVLLLHDMIDKKMKTKELEEEVMQSYEELEASYQDISQLNQQLNQLNMELQEKNITISSSENRYKVLIEKMKQGTMVLKKVNQNSAALGMYECFEMNLSMTQMRRYSELIDYIEKNVNLWLGREGKIHYNIENIYYEIDCSILSETEVMACVTDVTVLYEDLNDKTRQMWNLVTAMGKLVEKRDLYTADHQKKVAILAVEIAIEMGLNEKQIESIYIASMLHDIGKISIPAEILTKPDKLTNIEFELMKSHVTNAYDILKKINFVLPVTQIVMQHHERLDGSGYPEKIPGEKISIEARIVAVADVYEAINSHRPYRPSLGHEFAISHLEEESGRLYDESVVNACKRVSAGKRWELEDVENYLKKEKNREFELAFASGL